MCTVCSTDECPRQQKISLPYESRFNYIFVAANGFAECGWVVVGKYRLFYYFGSQSQNTQHEHASMRYASARQRNAMRPTYEFEKCMHFEDAFVMRSTEWATERQRKRKRGMWRDHTHAEYINRCTVTPHRTDAISNREWREREKKKKTRLNVTYRKRHWPKQWMQWSDTADTVGDHTAVSSEACHYAIYCASVYVLCLCPYLSYSLTEHNAHTAPDIEGERDRKR